MKRAIILLNGEPYEGEIDADGAYVYCCDGAYRWAKNTVKIDENLGDFDSLDEQPTPPPSQVYPSEKDYTDGELALNRAIERGFCEVEIYGGGGGREDHFLGNLHLLYQASERGISARMITNYATLFIGHGDVSLCGLKGKTCSIIPFGGKAHIMESNGFYYPLPEVFAYGSTLGISNVIVSDTAHFIVKERVLVAVNHEGGKG